MSKQTSILYVDDEPDIRLLCRLVLGRPLAVTAVAARLRKPDLPSEDTAVIVLTYPRAMGLLEASWNQIGGLFPGITSVTVANDAATPP